MRNSIKNNPAALDTYLALCREFPLASIRNDRHLSSASKVLNGLLARPKLDAGSREYLDALSDLIELYEDEHVKFEEPSDAEMLRFLMESKGVNQGGLVSDTGIGRSTISEVLAGKRPLTRKNVAILSKYFGVGQGTFSLSLDD
ncbi:MAG: hypothetical protein KF708_19700 [Pirellulales bacterium]|nr:hypothetical protein [Pirellulales bacterium]